MSLFANELAKLKLLAGSGGSSLLSKNVQVDPITKVWVPGASSDYVSSASSYVEASSIYRRCFNMGSGQFAVASRHYSPPRNAAQVYVQPFTVNQTTGAITIGSGSSSVNTSSNIDTGTFAQAGNYIMTSTTSPAIGNSVHGFTVSNNTVTSANYTTTNSSNHQPMSNNDTAYFRSGNTMYFYPQIYNQNDGRFRRASFSWNGSSVSQTEGPNDPGSNTSTNYSWPVVPQFGNNSPTNFAGIRSWQNGSSLPQWDILNNSGSYNSTINPATISVTGGITEGYGLELSNGRQLYYVSNGNIVLNNNGTLSNVTDIADFIPKSSGNMISTIYPVGVNEWVAVGNYDPREIVKFSVNPTTYRVTVLATAWLNNYLPDNSFFYDYSHISFTGSTNQFMVLATNPNYGPRMQVHVFPNPFTA